MAVKLPGDDVINSINTSSFSTNESINKVENKPITNDNFNRVQNPLHEFINYSYHHLLIICSNSVVAELVSQATDLAIFTKSDDFADYEVKSISNDGTVGVKGAGVGNFVVLINGMIDSEFVINSVKWSNLVMTVETNTNPDKPATKAGGATLEGEIEIQEPSGIRFVKVLMDIMHELNIPDFTAMPVLIKTIFVGYTATGVKTILQSPPLSCAFLDISQLYDATGGLYNIQFLGMAGSMPKNPQLARALDNVSIPLSGTFADAIVRLQDTINNRYNSMVSDKQDDLNTKFIAETGNSAIVGKKIKFIFIPSDPYAQVSNPDPIFLKSNKTVYTKIVANDSYKMEGTEDKNKDTGIVDESGRLSLSFNDIQSALEKIWSLCPKIRKDLNEGEESSNGDKIYYTPRVNSEFFITDDYAYIIYYITRTQRIVKKQSSDSQSSDIIGSVNSANLLQLDYLFTGKNVDVIEFNMKLSSGLGLFQLNNTISGTSTTGTTTGTPLVSTQTTTAKSIDNKIIPPSVFNIDSNRNISNDKQDYITFLNNMGNWSNLQEGYTTVKIVGNPDFLITNTSYSTALTKSLNGQLQNTPMSTFNTEPVIVKMNIKMPNPYLRRKKSPEDIPPYVDFWYQDPYSIVQIDNEFNNGEFTQTLSLLPLHFDNAGGLVLGTKDIVPLIGGSSVVGPDVKSKLSKEELQRKVIEFIKYLKSILQSKPSPDILKNKLTISKSIFFGGKVSQPLVITTYGSVIAELAKSSYDKGELKFIRNATTFDRTNFYQNFSERDKSQIIAIYKKYDVISSDEIDLINPGTNSIKLVLPEQDGKVRYIIGGLINRHEAEATMFES